VRGHGAKFPRKKEQAILALLTHSSVGEAARSVGISEATLWRWLQNPEFQKAYQEARRQTAQRAISQLQQLSEDAVASLKEVLLNQQTPPSTRVAAAKIVLEMTTKAVEMDDLLTRVQRLEQLIEQEH